MGKHLITKIGLFYAQVCSEGTYVEALGFIRSTMASGTLHNWQVHDEGNFAPVQCKEHSKRTHYMFNC